MVDIKGVKKTSLIDYPKHLCSTVFLGGCNFRCRFCHNPLLVFNKVDNYDEYQVISELVSRKKNISAVCITGGEPLMNKGVVEFIKKIKSAGFLVKVDTNGYFPGVLSELVDRKLVDYIAMDIKTSPEKYSNVTGTKIDIEIIKKSIEIIKSSGIEYDFRTTVVPGMFEEKDIEGISELIKGATNYTLQQFRSTEDMIDSSLQGINPYPISKLEEFKAKFDKIVENVRIVN